MARFWTLVWILLPAAALAPAAPALKDPPPKEPPITGEWLRVGHTEAGAPVGPDHAPHHQVFKADGQWEYWYGARPVTPTRAVFVTEPRQKPSSIDIDVRAGAGAYRGIYKVEGDTLTLCLVRGDRERPKVFESTADQPTTIWVFKRVQAKD